MNVTARSDMSDSTHRSRLGITQEFLLHISRGNPGEVMPLMSENVVYRAEGHHALAGVFTGRDAVARHLMQLVERTKGTFETFKWEDWMVGERHVVGLASVHAQANGRIYRGRTLTLVTFNVADQIEGMTVFFENPGAMDRFIGP
jgi:ketosteroid isomerase-like protein